MICYYAGWEKTYNGLVYVIKAINQATGYREEFAGKDESSANEIFDRALGENNGR